MTRLTFRARFSQNPRAGIRRTAWEEDVNVTISGWRSTVASLDWFTWKNFPMKPLAAGRYDPNGSIRSYTDREGGQYAYQYASWDKLVQFTDPLGRSVNYQEQPHRGTY